MNKGISYETFLEQNGELTYSNVGVSMLPLLRQGKDLFTVVKKTPERCREGDVVLYRRPPDQYVLHRIVAVRERDYVLLGDNCVNREYGIRDEDILGVMNGFVRNGKTHTVQEPLYRAYSFCMLHGAPLRVAVKRAELGARSLARRLLRR